MNENSQPVSFPGLITDLMDLAAGKEALVPFQLHPIMNALLVGLGGQRGDLKLQAQTVLNKLNKYERERHE